MYNYMRPMFCISLTPGILYVQRLFERVKGIRKFSFFFFSSQPHHFGSKVCSRKGRSGQVGIAKHKGLFLF